MRFISDVYPLFLLFLLFIVSRPVFAQKPDGMASNPIIWADVPDPSVIRVGNVYYMTSTTMHMNPGVPIMRSEDLVNWEIVNYVYHILDDSDKQTLEMGKTNMVRVRGQAVSDITMVPFTLCFFWVYWKDVHLPNGEHRNRSLDNLNDYPSISRYVAVI